MATSAAEFIPPRPTLESLRRAAAGCTGCPLHLRGTQTVFGEGPRQAPLMLVGEQPGDSEDLAGKPFVGPAGRLLDRALESAGIDRSKAYVTNVVKHFKWVPRGKRRMHSKPSAREIQACMPWLEAEVEQVKPEAIVCLGSTAAQALLGKDFRVTRQRGAFIPSNLAPYVTATVHPSSLLRIADARQRESELHRFVEDIARAAEAVGQISGTARRGSR